MTAPVRHPRVLVICPIATGGGVSEAFVLSLSMLRDDGMQPVALVPEGFQLMPKLRELGVETRTIAGLERGGALRLVPQIVAISRTASAVRADAVVTNNGRFVRGLKIAMPRIPLLAVWHGGKPERLMSADRIVTINDPQRDEALRLNYPPDRITVVDNALPLTEMPPLRIGSRRRGLDPVIGTLRLLEPAKGIDVLIEAVALSAERGRRFRTRIGSTGSQMESLKALAVRRGVADLIDFAGWIGDKDAFFDSIDVYVLPSRAEEWGIGIVEANAASLPVIATRTLGPMRIVDDGETGLLVRPGDAQELAEAIIRLADDPALAERLAAAAHRRCAERYLYPAVAPLFAAEVRRLWATKFDDMAA